MTLEALPTPSLLIDKNRLTQNLEQMQAKATAAGVALRPHTKTHKSTWIAARQRDAGAQGLTVAKVGEAEVFVEAGFDDVRLAYPIVGEDKHERLLALMDRARLSFCVDTEAGARAASDFYAARDRTAEVLIEIDTGHGRCGLWWEDDELPAFARLVAELPGLRLAGILTHAGQAYHGPHDGETPEQALRRASAEERDRMLAVAARLGAEGLASPDTFEVSIGSTPSMRFFENGARDGFRVTEIRPGNYVFFDATQVGLAAARLKDCALSVLTTVVSKRRDHDGTERLYLDAGKKVMTSDAGYGCDGYGVLLYNARVMEPLPHARITGLSEEHGWVQVAGGATLEVGDRVRLVPNHACVTVNTQDQMYVVEGEDVMETLTVDGRGRVV